MALPLSSPREPHIDTVHLACDQLDLRYAGAGSWGKTGCGSTMGWE